MLILPIKKKWFDMIKSGEKKEEYRLFIPYYHSRFARFIDEQIDVCFRNGYSNDSPSIICTVIPSYRTGGNAEWGAEPDTQYWVLKIISMRHKKSSP